MEMHCWQSDFPVIMYSLSAPLQLNICGHQGVADAAVSIAGWAVHPLAPGQAGCACRAMFYEYTSHPNAGLRLKGARDQRPTRPITDRSAALLAALPAFDAATCPPRPFGQLEAVLGTLTLPCGSRTRCCCDGCVWAARAESRIHSVSPVIDA